MMWHLPDLQGIWETEAENPLNPEVCVLNGQHFETLAQERKKKERERGNYM